MPKIRHEYTANYTVIDNTVVRDTRLSYKARGIFLYLWHLPEDWHISLADLQRHSQEDGDSAIRSGIKELVVCGYVSYVKIRQAGKIVDTLWTLCDKPFVENPQPGIPVLENHPPPKYYPERSTTKLSTGKRERPDPLSLSLSTPGSRCPENFEPTETTLAYAAKHCPDVRVDEQLDSFKDYEFPRPHQDWDATFKRWLRSAEQWLVEHPRTHQDQANAGESKAEAAQRRAWETSQKIMEEMDDGPIGPSSIFQRHQRGVSRSV